MLFPSSVVVQPYFLFVSLSGKNSNPAGMSSFIMFAYPLTFPSLKILLAGDALSPVMCMMFLNHTSLEEQLDTLYKVQNLDINTFITSHSSTWFDKSLIHRMILCIQNCKGKRFYPYQYPKPPHVSGYIYVDSIEEEPVGLIVESKDMIFV